MKINFNEEFIEAIITGNKITTIRKGRRVYPVGSVVELVSKNETFARARIDKVEIKKVRELTDEDALRDGFSSRMELLKELKKIYGSISSEDEVTIVHFTLV
ncbi:MAG: hypothetical protein PWR13_759 [Archaeoglobi archaeon]|nr:ASCH domain-containing protein [Candidatus Mnemosynella bozhongmuii]MDI3502513.1 hypothetical protein [Archaeoglobi archaeon]MDK2781731.1 hypothetical protein [Archaeoglobi archaeon]